MIGYRIKPFEAANMVAEASKQASKRKKSNAMYDYVDKVIIYWRLLYAVSIEFL